MSASLFIGLETAQAFLSFDQSMLVIPNTLMDVFSVPEELHAIVMELVDIL